MDRTLNALQVYAALDVPGSNPVVLAGDSHNAWAQVGQGFRVYASCWTKHGASQRRGCSSGKGGGMSCNDLKGAQLRGPAAHPQQLLKCSFAESVTHEMALTCAQELRNGKGKR